MTVVIVAHTQVVFMDRLTKLLNMCPFLFGMNKTWLLPFIFRASSFSLSHTHRVRLGRGVPLVQLVQLACLVGLVLRVPQVLRERREHL